MPSKQREHVIKMGSMGLSLYSLVAVVTAAAMDSMGLMDSEGI
jgi:hypothetical protein